HEREIDNLEGERRAIDEKSDAIRMLRQRLAEAESHEQALQGRLYELAGDERELENNIAQGSRFVGNARADAPRPEAAHSPAGLREAFADLDAAFTDPPLSTDDLFERKDRFRTHQEALIRSLRKALDPVRERVLDVMTKFLRVCPERATDLRA